MTGSRQGHGCTNSGRAAAPPTRSPRRFAVLGLGLFALLAVMVASFGASSASAYECYSGSSECATEGSLQHLDKPEASTSVFFMPKTTTSFVYWQPKGAPAFPKGYETAVTDFFKGLEHENGSDQDFYSVLTQYGVNDETHFGKAIKDKDPYPAESSGCDLAEPAPPSRPCISVLQIEAEVKELVKTHKLPKQVNEAGQFEATNIFFVMLPPGVSVCDYRYETKGVQHVSAGCSGERFCAYHDNFVNSSEERESPVWAVMAYLPGIKGCEDPQHPNSAYEDEFPPIEHEFAEATTDPYAVGWFNESLEGSEEVVDICQDGFWGFGNVPFEEKMRYGTALGTAPNGALYNQVIDGRYYYLQQLYSNATETCVQRKALAPVVSKLAPAKGPIAGDKKVKITGLNFENPTVTSVSFGKTAATSFTVTSPTSMTAVSPASTATGAVAVTVTTTGGTNVSVPADQFTYGTK
jgi:IPT/TIG domain